VADHRTRPGQRVPPDQHSIIDISARNLMSQAQVTEPPSQRRPLIKEAIAKLDAARNAVATTP
jgi:hypothetical protein